MRFSKPLKESTIELWRKGELQGEGLGDGGARCPESSEIIRSLRSHAT